MLGTRHPWFDLIWPTWSDPTGSIVSSHPDSERSALTALPTALLDPR